MEIITILIIATIPMVGIALLFWIIRLCQVLTTSLTARDEDISRLTNERDSHARTITDLNQKIASLEAENIANQETTTNHLNQWNETVTEIRQEMANERDSHARKITDLNQEIASLKEENATIQETTVDHLSQWNETITEIRQEIANIPIIHIERGWKFPDVSPGRRRALIAMAQDDYQQFLDTDEWQRWAWIMKDHFKYKCQACNSPNQLEVHHRTYGSVGRECPGDLTVLCRECHQLIHDHREHLIPWPWN